VVDSDGHWPSLTPMLLPPPCFRRAVATGDVLATSTALDLAAVTPQRWIAQGATISIPLTSQALDLGAPLANVTVNFTLTRVPLHFPPASATTNASDSQPSRQISPISRECGV